MYAVYRRRTLQFARRQIKSVYGLQSFRSRPRGPISPGTVYCSEMHSVQRRFAFSPLSHAQFGNFDFLMSVFFKFDVTNYLLNSVDILNGCSNGFIWLRGNLDLIPIHLLHRFVFTDSTDFMTGPFLLSISVLCF